MSVLSYIAARGGTFERGEQGRRGFRAVATGNEANSMDASDAARASLSTYPTPLSFLATTRCAHHPRSFAVINERLDAARRKQPRRHLRSLFRLSDFQRERAQKRYANMLEKKIREITELKPHS